MNKLYTIEIALIGTVAIFKTPEEAFSYITEYKKWLVECNEAFNKHFETHDQNVTAILSFCEQLPRAAHGAIWTPFGKYYIKINTFNLKGDKFILEQQTNPKTDFMNKYPREY